MLGSAMLFVAMHLSKEVHLTKEVHLSKERPPLPRPQLACTSPAK